MSTHINLMRCLLISALFSVAITSEANDLTGLYVTGSIGKASEEYPEGLTTQGLESSGVSAISTTIKKNPIGFKLRIGYQININLGLEAGYSNFGKISYDAKGTQGGTSGVFSDSLKVNAVDASVIGILPIGGSFSALGKLGVASVKSSESFSTTFDSANQLSLGGRTATDITYGIGGVVDISNNSSLRADYDRYNTDVKNLGWVDFWSIGIIYKF